MSQTKKNATYASILCPKEQAISASLHKTWNSSTSALQYKKLYAHFSVGFPPPFLSFVFTPPPLYLVMSFTWSGPGLFTYFSVRKWNWEGLGTRIYNNLAHNTFYTARSWCCCFTSLPTVDITTQPMSQQDVVPGTTITFVVEAKGSDLTYLWQRNGETLTDVGKYSGTTTPTLTVMNVTEEDEGNFTCAVTKNGFTVTSSAAELTVRKWLTVCVCVRIFLSRRVAGNVFIALCVSEKKIIDFSLILHWRHLFVNVILYRVLSSWAT